MVPWDVPCVVWTVYERGILQNRGVSTQLNQSCRQDLVRLPFRVEDDLAALFRGLLVGAAVKEGVAVGVPVARLAVTTEVEAAEFLVLSLLVVVGKVVGLCCTDVDAGRAGFVSAVGHDHGATTVGVSLVLLRNLHLVIAGY